MIVYTVGYINEFSRSPDEIIIVAIYSESQKQKADQLRQELEDKGKGDSQFCTAWELDPVKVDIN